MTTYWIGPAKGRGDKQKPRKAHPKRDCPRILGRVRAITESQRQARGLGTCTTCGGDA